LFFQSIALGVEGSGTPAVTEAGKIDPKDDPAAEGHCWAHDQREHWKHHHRGHHLWKELNLTDAQKKEMFSIRLDERAKMKPLVQKLKEGREQLRALPKGQFDEAKVRAIAKGQADIMAELIVERARMMSKMYAVLTPEQRAKAEKIHESWKAGHEKKHEHKE
jgi:Spy/CpxP family protein refolding chaperone